MKLPENISAHVKLALQEDIGSGDVTADLIPKENQSKANVVCRDDATLSGIHWFNEVFQQIDPDVEITWHFQDGERVEANEIICTLTGNSRSILSGERAALNFLQTLSATATQTQKFVSKIKGTNARILDTRKTIPNLRDAQKYAVLCGGGKNHRIGLYDMILIKENHIMAAGSITEAVKQAKQLHPEIRVEVETESLEEFREATAAGADVIMLDNFDLKTMREAVVENDGRISLEASGGVNLDTVRGIAETGVDFISVGQITKDIAAVDLSMRFEN
ncbi:carboxylating nicotinate-nucleotide diphosphorylase [Cocleimonas sp. KMM 6892]|uniref:carboxylating nicotinate-nucleotide diphosphorylase n=1 Tax=unclassified Cocleimonas TaxID=2639732 RepID=UPI002DBF5A3D|nr:MULTISPECIES: carboxylating nicotinate-nucleotide diphosphorylase [unclassified Cocleimonas]MEB8431146.1 carboxylating nicotinate-nucleotide diphosphorylase [Cocleimonas sp. KMM 6892]MEC4714082.1 carboxylating nicotinate-nucleotide diphosphorylase [Cocleimonas sp. KMM 6895]MEC4743413.1 carboxylating nicotinate-nucleotide diphosphorylase [Cocleimonas sp. KMM 6896]